MRALERVRASATEFIRTRREALNAKDLGQNLLEYVGLVILVAAVVAAIMGTGTLSKLTGSFKKSVNCVINGQSGNCPGNNG